MNNLLKYKYDYTFMYLTFLLIKRLAKHKFLRNQFKALNLKTNLTNVTTGPAWDKHTASVPNGFH